MTVEQNHIKRALGHHPWRVLLPLLVASILARPVLGEAPGIEAVQTLFFWVIFFGTIEVAGANPVVLRLSRITLIAWIGMQMLSIATDKSLVALNFAVTILNLLLASGVILYTFKELLETEKVDFDTVLAAIFGYLLIASGFALVYGAIDATQTGAFDLGTGPDTFSTFMYFSLVTMTTLGYGDILPVSDFVRLLAGFQAVFGTLYFAVFVGALVGRL